MDRASRQLHTSRRIVSSLSAFGLLVGIFAVLVPEAGASPGAPCRVTNLRTGDVYDGSGSNLQSAIDAAQSGSRLRIRGVCAGTFVIARNLKLVGHSTAAYPTPTLDGNAAGTVLTVNAGTVMVKDLTITNGSTIDAGGGIYNGGTLILLGSTAVAGNAATGSDRRLVGAGIYNAGALTLKGSSSVTANTTGDTFSTGGGIYNAGTLTLMGSSSVMGNEANNGGGIYNDHATATLMGSSSVIGNTAEAGGGIYNNGGSATLTLMDASRVKRNRSVDNHGGGIYNLHGTVTLDGSSSVAGNVAFFYGGGIFNNHATLVMNDVSTVTHNRTISLDGGGIYNDRGDVALNGSTVVGANIAARDGGGIYNRDGFNGTGPTTLTLSGSSSVMGNAATRTGGGVFNHTAAFKVCDTWTGTISPNTPDDAPPAIPLLCN